MNRKFLGIIIVIAGFFLLVGIVYVIFWGEFSISGLFNRNKETEVATTTAPVTVPVQTKTSAMEAVIRQREASQSGETRPVEGIKRNEVAAFNKEDLTRLAASFAERIGSYSNHSNFVNIIDLKVFMSEKMQRWADSYVAEQRKKDLTKAIYFGITTKAIEKDVKEFDDNVGIASVLVTTRRREYAGATNNLSNTYNQAVLINFINENGAWKVDEANWQDKK